MIECINYQGLFTPNQAVKQCISNMFCSAANICTVPGHVIRWACSHYSIAFTCRIILQCCKTRCNAMLFYSVKKSIKKTQPSTVQALAVRFAPILMHYLTSRCKRALRMCFVKMETYCTGHTCDFYIMGSAQTSGTTIEPIHKGLRKLSYMQGIKK